MEKIIIATKNPGKAKEFQKLFSDQYEIVTLNDLTDLPTIIENGSTFKENATIKAQTIYKATNETVIADDSGLVVDALNGEPGIYSARYAKDHDSKANMDKLINKIKKIPPQKRTAHFITVLVVISKYGKIEETGRVDGLIIEHPKGNDGFGYDPIFYYPPKDKTFAEMTMSEKNQISHRGKAMEQLIKDWPEYLKGENNENLNLQ
ncbi:XTP/dITP diphosphatase [Xylocopilactobacillus apicola]|uniref:dITP/XTP pyrophosphatase n=1 Tax=Xylocopilactobacillus apicola TaxID=2932184 RepID=A0AAU9DXE8_9LACO|nr:XTP/dITP diphosphatase [Xylocopilactobacillus apicola]BDR58788.1 non-canonical purine NTP pyrophosphatase [Xylocopilactobacillus apicola]